MRLNRRLVLEEAQRLPDGGGGHRLTWVALGTVWADVAAGSGREREGGELTLSSVPCRITVRAAPYGAPSRPRPDQRFREGQRVFRITAVGEADASGSYLVCQTSEEVVA